MTSELQSNSRITELEDRVLKLEKILDDKEDVLNPNFDGYETLNKDDLEILEDAEKEIVKGNVKSLDDVLTKLE